MTNNQSIPSDESRRSEFDRFESLARRILTTPKSELAKDAPKAKIEKSGTKKKHR